MAFFGGEIADGKKAGIGYRYGGNAQSRAAWDSAVIRALVLLQLKANKENHVISCFRH
jgi:hypothetical protein